MKKFYLFLFCSLTLSNLLGQGCVSDRYTHPVFPNVTKTSQVLYGSAIPYGLPISQDLYLDIYQPTGDTLRNRPLMIYAYGGAFLIGDKNQPPVPTFCEYFAKCGYVVVSIDYRKGFNVVDASSPPRAVYRAAQDERAAMRFLCQRAGAYRIDTAAIFLTGSSAGCFSALHQTFLEESQRPAETYGTFLEPDDLGCFDCSGNTDNNRHCPRIRGIINNWGAILDTSFIEGNKWSDSVAVISFHGDQDPLVPYVSGNPFSYPVFPVVYGSKAIHRRMTNQHMKNKLVPLVGEGHEPWLLNASLLDTVYKYTCPFLLETLKPGLPVISGMSTICIEDSALYQVQAHSGSQYCWQLDSGGTILSVNNNLIKIKWEYPGVFKLKLRELSKNEVNSDLAEFEVHVLSRPVAGFGDSVFHTEVIFWDSSANANSVQYRFGDGTYSGNSHPVHQYSGAGNFMVWQIASNGYCADSVGRLVETDTCPVIHFTWSISADSFYFVCDPAGTSIKWHFGDGDSSVEVAPVHHYETAQNYLVSLQMVSGKNCELKLNQIINYIPEITGINYLNNSEIKLFPNPFVDHFVISLPAGGSGRIADALGKVVKSFVLEHGTNTIEIEPELAAGLYTLELTSGDKKRNYKVLKSF
ncbi:MAG: carboxylesterase family protein [Chitinophagales bacterium]